MSPATLVAIAITIALATVATALFIAHHHSCHHHCCPCRGPLSSSLPTTLVALAIAHVIDVKEEGRRAL